MAIGAKANEQKWVDSLNFVAQLQSIVCEFKQGD